MTIGAGLIGVGAAALNAIAGAVVWGLAFISFLVASGVIVAGEVRTYRALPGQRGGRRR